MIEKDNNIDKSLDHLFNITDPGFDFHSINEQIIGKIEKKERIREAYKLFGSKVLIVFSALSVGLLTIFFSGGSVFNSFMANLKDYGFLLSSMFLFILIIIFFNDVILRIVLYSNRGEQK